MKFYDGIPTIDGVAQIPLNGKYQIDQCRLTDGSLTPVLRVLTSGGMSYLYLPPDLADGLAGAMVKAAAACRAGLVLDDDTNGQGPPGKLIRG